MLNAIIGHKFMVHLSQVKEYIKAKIHCDKSLRLGIEIKNEEIFEILYTDGTNFIYIFLVSKVHSWTIKKVGSKHIFSFRKSCIIWLQSSFFNAFKISIGKDNLKVSFLIIFWLLKHNCSLGQEVFFSPSLEKLWPKTPVYVFLIFFFMFLPVIGR